MWRNTLSLLRPTVRVSTSTRGPRRETPDAATGPGYQGDAGARTPAGLWSPAARPQPLALNRRSAAGAFAVGLFMMYMPPFGQWLMAAAAAIVFRVNLPIAVALVFITNPITIPPMFYVAYLLGALVLGQAVAPFDLDFLGGAGQLADHPLPAGPGLPALRHGLLGAWILRCSPGVALACAAAPGAAAGPPSGGAGCVVRRGGAQVRLGKPRRGSRTRVAVDAWPGADEQVRLVFACCPRCRARETFAIVFQWDYGTIRGYPSHRGRLLEPTSPSNGGELR